MTLPDHIRATLKLGLPLIGGQVAHILIGVTDTVMIGWYGVGALAAVAMGASILHFLMVIGLGFALAMVPLAASSAEKGDSAQVRRVTRMGLWIAIAIGLGLAPAYWFSEAILLFAGQDPQVAADAQSYLRIAGLSLVPVLGALTLRSHLSALERTGVVLWAWLAGLALNAVLNWVLIFGNLGAPEMGIQGAALASLGTNLLIFLVLAVYSARAPGMAEFALFTRFWNPDWEALGQVLRLGLPVSATLIAETGLFMATFVLMGWIGTLELAAHGVALQIISVPFMVHIGLSSAATVRIGQAHGRADREGVRRAALAVLILALAMAVLTVAALVSLPQVWVGLFVDPDDPLRPQIIAIGAGLLIVAAVFQLADAGQILALALLRGLKDTGWPMVITFISYWLIGIPAAWGLGLPLGYGGQGIWAGLLIGLTIACAFLFARFARVSAGVGAPAAPSAKAVA